MLQEKDGASYGVDRAEKPDARLAAQKLQAGIYLDRGYVEPHHIDKHGKINNAMDPHQEHSEYFYATSKNRKKILAVARQINAKKEKGYYSFQTYGDLKISAEGEHLLGNYPPEQCVEISALSKAKGVHTYVTFVLYRFMWQYSLRVGHKIWIMACDINLYNRLKSLFGGALIKAGEVQFYKGHDVVPVIIEIDKSLDELKKSGKTLHPIKRLINKQLVAFFLRGIPETRREQ